MGRVAAWRACISAVFAVLQELLANASMRLF